MPSFYVLVNPWTEHLFGTTIASPPTADTSLKSRTSMVVACRDVDKVYHMRRLLLENHQQTGRWINRYEHMSWRNDHDTVLTLSENLQGNDWDSPEWNRHLVVMPMDFETVPPKPLRREMHASELCMRAFKHAHLFLADDVSRTDVSRTDLGPNRGETNNDTISTVLTLQGVFVDMHAVGLYSTPVDDWPFIESCWQQQTYQNMD